MDKPQPSPALLAAVSRTIKLMPFASNMKGSWDKELHAYHYINDDNIGFNMTGDIGNTNIKSTDAFDKLLDNIKTLLDYYWQEEEKDYESLVDSGHTIPNHIFLTLQETYVQLQYVTDERTSEV